MKHWRSDKSALNGEGENHVSSFRSRLQWCIDEAVWRSFRVERASLNLKDLREGENSPLIAIIQKNSKKMLTIKKIADNIINLISSQKN